MLTRCRHLSSMAWDESSRTMLSIPALPPQSRDAIASPAPPKTAMRGNVLLQSSKRSSSLSATSAYKPRKQLEGFGTSMPAWLVETIASTMCNLVFADRERYGSLAKGHHPFGVWLLALCGLS